MRSFHQIARLRIPLTTKSASRAPHSVQRSSRAQSVTGNTGAVLGDRDGDVRFGAVVKADRQ
jgi:hypothetical protein